MQARDWATLFKFRIQGFSTPAAVACCWLAHPTGFSWVLALHLVAGLTLASCGASALNQAAEAKLDGLMERTRHRPIPTGKLSKPKVTGLGWGLAALGVAWLALATTPLSAWLAVIMIILYVFIYTPLKTVTELNTIVGALPGALPLLVGYAAADQGLDLLAGIVFAVLFLWQLPHFMAIAWLYREDYQRAGMRMLPSADVSGRMSGRQAAHWAMTLLPVSLLPTMVGQAGKLYFYSALSLALLFLATVFHFALRRDAKRARILLFASLVYLPLLFLVLVLDGPGAH